MILGQQSPRKRQRAARLACCSTRTTSTSFGAQRPLNEHDISASTLLSCWGQFSHHNPSFRRVLQRRPTLRTLTSVSLLNSHRYDEEKQKFIEALFLSESKTIFRARNPHSESLLRYRWPEPDGSWNVRRNARSLLATNGKSTRAAR